MDVESLRESHSVLALFLSSLHILGLFFLIMLPADVCVDSQTRSSLVFVLQVMNDEAHSFLS